MAAIEKTMMAMTVAVFGVVVMAQVVQGLSPAPPAPPQYCCPLCDVCFYTYDELYSHFTAEHPTTPIDIIWQ